MESNIYQQILKRIESINKDKPILIAIDGVDGAGKSFFANKLYNYLLSLNKEVIHTSIDYCHNKREIRHSKNKPSYISLYEDSFNYTALKRVLLDSLSNESSGKCELKYFDHKTDQHTPSSPIKFTSDTILIIDGIFSQRDEICGYWDLTIFLDVDFDETYRRMNIRDGCPTNPLDKANERYYKGQKLYLEKCNPKSKADFVIDNNNFC